jgi:hypothetical protein
MFGEDVEFRPRSLIKTSLMFASAFISMRILDGELFVFTFLYLFNWISICGGFSPRIIVFLNRYLVILQKAFFLHIAMG